MAPQSSCITGGGIPVMAHIGFTPQSEHALGGYRVQGRGDGAEQMIDDALALEAAGAFAVVHGDGARRRRGRGHQGAAIPTIGIGAGVRLRRPGAGLAGRVRAAHRPDGPFVKQYADLHGVLLEAAQDYADDVRAGTFPATEHSFES